jgi:diadenosine tetraphosphatase ApaH/serine/threonine PP2A family protein phosphatase
VVAKKLSNVEVYRILADPDLIAELDAEQIEGLLSAATESLVGTPPIVAITSTQPVVVVGDLHGNFDGLVKVYNAFQLQGTESCVFLGDYVDRGDMSVEVLNFVLVLRQRYGPNVVLLRGNHEDWEVNKVYGFATELEVKGLAGLQPMYERLYDALPRACVVNSPVLCIHGGVPKDITKLDEIATLDPLLRSSTFLQMTWNDPIEEPDAPTFSDNPRGDGIYYFGEQVFRAFMQANGFSKMIRAHEWQPEGFRWFFGEDLLSIFSAENYTGLMNPACVAIIRESTVEPQML